jgi:hypothetical protein
MNLFSLFFCIFAKTGLQGLVLPGRVWKPTITTTTAHP